MALRFDRGTLKKPVKMSNGWLKADAYLTRTGVFIYRGPGGAERRELRLPEEVFHADALASFALVPITNDHPPEPLTADNTKQYAVGAVGEVVARDDNFVRASILVTDAQAIRALESGKQELSCGYECDLEETPGEYQGQRYDAIQRRIRGNHTAIVDHGRAGPQVRVKMDAADAYQIAEDSSAQPQEFSVKKIRIDGVEYEVSEQVAQAYEKFQARFDAQAEELKKAKGELETTKARLDSREEELKKEKQARADAADPKKLLERVKARVALEVQARQHLGAEVKLDELDDKGVKLAVLAKLKPEFKADDKSEEYINARYDLAVEDTAKSTDNSALSDARKAALPNPAPTNTARADAEKIDEDEARRQMEERSRTAYKKPLMKASN